MPTTHSLILLANRNWFIEQIIVQGGAQMRRHEVANIPLNLLTYNSIRIPVRNLRVLYVIPNTEYLNWMSNHVPSGYEFFMKHSSLKSYNAPKVQEFLRRMSVRSQFYTTR